MKSHSVTTSADLMGQAVAWLRGELPNEGLLFVAGKIRGSAPHRYEVTHLYMPAGRRGTPTGVTWTNDDRSGATAWALENGVTLLGIGHSHICLPGWDERYTLMQSMRDANMQAQYHFPLSLVVGFFGKEASAAWWLGGYAAPLDASIRLRSRKVMRMETWFQRVAP